MINPQILEKSQDLIDGWEGCFSVPGYMGMVPRSTNLKLRYFTADGNEHVETFSGYVARVIQHEFDHLEGTIYLDRMPSTETLCTKPNYLHFGLYQSNAS
jgi:peptide deformylase